MISEIPPKIGDLALGGRYQLLSEAKGSIGGGPVLLGKKGVSEAQNLAGEIIGDHWKDLKS